MCLCVLLKPKGDVGDVSRIVDWKHEHERWIEWLALRRNAMPIGGDLGPLHFHKSRNALNNVVSMLERFCWLTLFYMSLDLSSSITVSID